MADTTEGVTITGLVEAAWAAGHPAAKRLVRDWTERGLLDSPKRRPAGKGHGSRPALYAANQRDLFLTLLGKRAEAKTIASLARLPVFVWMHWGEEYVPLCQARRAFTTWLGDPRMSMQRARASARAVLIQLDHPGATRTARDNLLATLADIAYTGGGDLEGLDLAVRAVFEPTGPRRREAGHPTAPLRTDSVVTLINARLSTIEATAAGRVTDEQFLEARQQHLIASQHYEQDQALMAADGPPGMYEPLNWQRKLNDCCNHLLTIIGLKIISNEPILK
ncbi:hypothetical protein [Amycolatopsis sp. NPDC054798]